MGYACQFWAKYLMEIPSSSYGIEEVHKAIDGFFKTCLLFWVEILIVMGCLDISVYTINNIQQRYTSVSDE